VVRWCAVQDCLKRLPHKPWELRGTVTSGAHQEVTIAVFRIVTPSGFQALHLKPNQPSQHRLVSSQYLVGTALGLPGTALGPLGCRPASQHWAIAGGLWLVLVSELQVLTRWSENASWRPLVSVCVGCAVGGERDPAQFASLACRTESDRRSRLSQYVPEPIELRARRRLSQYHRSFISTCPI